MSYKPVPHSFLLKTSTTNSVLYGANNWSFPGSRININPNTISFVKQMKQRAEVAQQQTIGTDSYIPTASTAYTVLINDPNRHSYGATQPQIPFSFVTPPVITSLGATAALQREAIHAVLITAINNATNTIFATATTLGTGTGFTIIDNGGYYGTNGPRPVGGPTILGPNQIYTAKNPDGTGFIDANTRTVTVAAVYSFGVGATLLADKAVIDPMFGNIISGTVIAGSNGQTIPSPVAADGTSAISGQNYDAFIFSSLTLSAIPNATAVQGYNIQNDAVFVDNGTGSSTTNLAGFIAFERQMLRGIFSLFIDAPSATYDFFDQAFVASATYPTTGLAVTTSDNVVMAVESTTGMAANTWYINPIGSHTIITPIVTTAGSSLSLDATTQKGLEISAPNLTQCPKEFVVGQSEYSWYARVTATNYAHLVDFAVGLRKKAAYAVNLIAYDVASVDFAAIGVVHAAGTGLINIETSKAAGGVVATSTATTWTSGAHDIMIKVDLAGNVRFFIDNVDVTSKQATAYTFVAGTHVMPFIDAALDVNVDAAPFVIQCAALPTTTWRGYTV